MKTFRSFLCLLAAHVLISAAATNAWCETGSVGIYTDESGTTCSFNGNEAGLVTAYVVVRPGPEGVRAVRFSAPVPACLGAVFVQDAVPSDLPWIGDSQTGISVASGHCEMLPLHVLTISYMRTGSTTPCCPYPVLPEPGLEVVQAVNCAGEEISYGAVTSHFNADESCECAAGVPPFPPAGPSPWNGQTAVSSAYEDTLKWSGSDYDGDLADFDIHLGASTDPPLVAAHVAGNAYRAVLAPSTHYYWRVVARDSRGHTTTGPTWEFWTRALSSPPLAPEPSYPPPGEVTARHLRLEWQSGDVDHDYPLKYDVYFGTSNPPARVATGETTPFRYTGMLRYGTTYYWRIVVRDMAGNQTVGDVWHFTTTADNNRANAAFSPLPADGTTDVAINAGFAWHGSAEKYAVYMGRMGTPQDMVAWSLTTPHFQPQVDLLPETEYYWYVVSYFGSQLVYGPVWRFTTAPPPPNLASEPALAYNANVATLPTLTWSVAYANGRPLTFEVYLGDRPSPPLLVTTTERSAATGALRSGRHYYWRVDTWDGETRTSGREWSFSTPATGMTLGQNYPNPFNPQTIIPYSVNAGPVRVRIAIYDPAGREVRLLIDENQGAGRHEVIWRGNDTGGHLVPSGVYFCVLEAADYKITRKLLLLK